MMRSGIPERCIVSAGRDLACAIVAIAVALCSQASPAQSPPQIDQDGTIHIPAFLLPESSLLDEGSRAALKHARDNKQTLAGACPTAPEGADHAASVAARDCEAESFYKTAFYGEFRKQYDVVMTRQEIGGVQTEVFKPRSGVAPTNLDRVLINVHGGHFKMGSRVISHLESIPIAGTGKIEVVSVDYRMAPEYAFPAASEDVEAVYRELLKTYKPQNIGIYGCSAGGLLTAESIAWLEKDALPLPGAVGMFGSGAAYYQEGDSAPLASVRDGFPLEPSKVHPYFKGTDAANPLAFPIHSSKVMAKFPPSLLITSSRDLALSSVVRTHSELVKLGVEADLHVWEGMQHCFPFGLDLPQSNQAREVNESHEVIVKFFDQHLGK
jgi:epsilon-lactone hydrolase